MSILKIVSGMLRLSSGMLKLSRTSLVQGGPPLLGCLAGGGPPWTDEVRLSFCMHELSLSMLSLSMSNISHMFLSCVGINMFLYSLWVKPVIPKFGGVDFS